MDNLASEATEFGISKVEPTYPIWWTDTVAGVATVGILTVLLCSGILAASLFTCYVFRIACFEHCTSKK